MRGPFFIVCTGRSGSTSIARLLSVIHNAYSVHEMAPEMACESSAYRYGEVQPETIRQILRETREPIAKQSILIESNQVLSLIIPEIVQVFPRAKFIWLIRNGMDVVASAMQKQWYTPHGENHDRYEDCTPLQKAWIDGRITADRCGDLSTDEWERLDRFARCCWYWGYVNRIIDHDLAAYAPESFFVVHLEALGASMKRLIKWMGMKIALLPQTPRLNTARRTPYHWTAWSGSERNTFIHFCGELMDRFYPAWRSEEGAFQRIDYGVEKRRLPVISTRLDWIRNINTILARNTPK